MLRSFLILFNLLAFSLWKLFFPITVNVSQTVPSSSQRNNSFMVQVAINKADLKGVAKFSEQLPAGLTAVPIDNDGARSGFADNVIQFSWDSLPAEGIINISFRVDVGSMAMLGQDTLKGRFLYTADNQKLETDGTPSYISITDVSPPAGAAETTRQVDSVKMCSGGIFVSRHFPTPSISPNTSAKITLIVHKPNIKGFAKISDSIPPGFTASVTYANGASFTFVNNAATFVWENIPSDSIISTSYQLLAGSDVSGIHVISGNFSYIFNTIPYTCSIGSTIFNTSVLHNANDKTQNNGGNEQVVAENNQSTTTETSQVTSQNNVSATVEPNQVAANENPTIPQTDANYQANAADGVTPSIAAGEAGISYRVQIMALHKPVDVSYFSLKRKMNLFIRTEMEGGFTKYTVGNYSDYKTVREAREKIRDRGIKGPFVVSYNSGVRITVQEALMITHQQWYK